MIKNKRKISLSELFEKETKFSSWLSKHLYKLTPLLNRQLKCVGKEQRCDSPKRVDILAIDEMDNRIVIENQFGLSNWNHLGKIISYALKCNAKCAVWISEEFEKYFSNILVNLGNKIEVDFILISAFNPTGNMNKEKVVFKRPVYIYEVNLNDKLIIKNAKIKDDKVEVNQELLSLINEYQEIEGKKAVYRKSLIGTFQYWLCRKDGKNDVPLYLKYFKGVKDESQPGEVKKYHRTILS